MPRIAIRVVLGLAAVVVGFADWLFAFAWPDFGATFGIFGMSTRTPWEQAAYNWSWVFSASSVLLLLSILVAWRRQSVAILIWLSTFLVMAGLGAAAYKSDWVLVFLVLVSVTLAWVLARRLTPAVPLLNGYGVSLLWIVTVPLTLGLHAYHYREQIDYDRANCLVSYGWAKTYADTVRVDNSFGPRSPVAHWTGPNWLCGEMRRRGIIR